MQTKSSTAQGKVCAIVKLQNICWEIRLYNICLETKAICLLSVLRDCPCTWDFDENRNLLGRRLLMSTWTVLQFLAIKLLVHIIIHAFKTFKMHCIWRFQFIFGNRILQDSTFAQNQHKLQYSHSWIAIFHIKSINALIKSTCNGSIFNYPFLS